MKILGFLLLVSCTNSYTNKSESVKRNTLKTSVKIFRDSVFVDSLITIVPITTDSTQFISFYLGDSMEMISQKTIFELRRVSNSTSSNQNTIKDWFTRLAIKTDSVKDFGLFIVLKNDKAIEHCRFRVNRKGEILGVNVSPFLFDKFDPINKWMSDTIPLPE